MTSAIDASVPVVGNPTTASVRNNFQIAHDEITALQSGKAPIDSPIFTGNPTAPTPNPGDNDTSIATTAFVAAATTGKFVPITPRGNIALAATEPGLVSVPGTDGGHVFSAIESTHQIGFNCYWDGTVWRYRTAGFSATLSFGRGAGDLILYGNASGAIDAAQTGTIQLMSLDRAGTFRAYGDIRAGAGMYANTIYPGYTNAPAYFMSADATSNYLSWGSNTYFVYNRASSAFNYNTNETGSVLSIASNGNATHRAATGVNIQGTNASGTNWGINFLNSGGTQCGNLTYNGPTSYTVMGNQLGTGSYLQLNWDGSLSISGATAAKPGGGAWAASSDARIKTVEGEYTQGLADVLRLRPVLYHYLGNDTMSEDINDTSQAPPGTRAVDAAPYPASPHYRLASADVPMVGLIAQEVEPIFPGMVTTYEGFIDGAPVADLRRLDTGPLIFALVNAVKELSARIDAIQQPAQGA